MEEASEIAQFRIVRLLGRGGMGEVWLARDGEVGGEVALKRLATTTGEDLLRLKREFRALADLSHPNLVQLYDLVGVDGSWFFTMEVVHGVGFSLDALVAGEHDRILHVGDEPSTLDTATAHGTVELEGPPASLARRIARLRTTLPGLARGLAALHDAGLTHGDVKPSNVLVEPGGRAVVLDFGLVQRVGPEASRLEGTPLYLAPEVLRGEPRRPPADWYAVGTMLYEALTDRLTDDSTVNTLIHRRLTAPRHHLELPPEVPADLARLVLGLLDPDPVLRAGAADVLAWAEQDAVTPSSSHEAFVGRADELERLRLALGGRSVPTARLVLVRGRSGIGKTTLLRRFVEDVAEPARALVLEGVCHDREALPFNAFDRVIDGLVAALERLPPDLLSAVLPEGVGELATMFPVLGALFPPTRREDDAATLRQVAFQALRTLLARLAARRRVVIVLDDVQWADRDSVQLLRALLEPPSAPPVLLVLAARTEPGDADPVDALHADGTVVRFERIELGPLGPAEARTLARMIGVEVSAEEVARVVAETGGVPLLVDQALRFGRARDGSAAAVLQERVAALAPTERAVLAVVAIASERLRLSTALRVAGVTEDGATVLAALRRARLVRTHGARPSDRLEPYHGRVRELVLAGLSRAEQVGLHLALADDVVTKEPGVVVALERALAADAPTPSDTASRALPYVRHLRAAFDLDPDAIDAVELARLELAAGLHVRAGRAYAAAVDVLRGAAGLVDAVVWDRDRALAWRVHLELARALALAADFVGCLDVVAALLPRARGTDERVALLRLKIGALVATQAMATALDTALDALALLGTRLPRHPRTWHVAGALVRTKLALRGRDAAALRSLPRMRDRTALAAVAIERAVLTACFVAEPDLFPILVFDMVRKTLRHGHAPESAAAWVGYGLVASGVLGDLRGGAAFGELGRHVLDTLRAEDQRAVVEGICGGFLVHWVEPMIAALPILERGWRAGTASGDFEFGGMCASIGAYQRWFAGLPLDGVHRAAADAVDELPRLGQDRTAADLTRLVQLCAGLRGEDVEHPPWALKGRDFDVDVVLPRQIAARDCSNVASLRSFLAFLAYVYGDLEAAVGHADRAEADLPALVGTVNLVFGTFVAGLARFASATRQRGDARRRAIADGRRARRQLATWAAKGPGWCAPLHDLVRAEELRLAGDRPAAAVAFRAALDGAEREGMLHVEALAAEAAARFHLADEPGLAWTLWTRARDAWIRWGAVSRVATMTPEPDPWPSRHLPAWPPGVSERTPAA